MRKLGPSSTHGFNQTVMIGDGRYAVLSGGAHTVQDGDRYLTKLTLPAVKPSHEGVYVCMAANENGFSGREAFLHVAPGEYGGFWDDGWVTQTLDVSKIEQNLPCACVYCELEVRDICLGVG